MCSSAHSPSAQEYLLLTCPPPAGVPWNFSFNVKFYPPDPAQLSEDLTRCLTDFSSVSQVSQSTPEAATSCLSAGTSCVSS